MKKEMTLSGTLTLTLDDKLFDAIIKPGKANGAKERTVYCEIVGGESLIFRFRNDGENINVELNYKYITLVPIEHFTKTLDFDITGQDANWATTAKAENT